jgi:hypothetical protein
VGGRDHGGKDAKALIEYIEKYGDEQLQLSGRICVWDQPRRVRGDCMMTRRLDIRIALGKSLDRGHTHSKLHLDGLMKDLTINVMGSSIDKGRSYLGGFR